MESFMKRWLAMFMSVAVFAVVASAVLPTSSIAQEQPCADPMGCGGGEGEEGGPPCTPGTVRKTYLCDFCRYDSQWISFPTHYVLIWQGDGTIITRTCQSNGTWGGEEWAGALCGGCNVR
jgi:hypothetical protein